jgi:hypothetical protein
VNLLDADGRYTVVSVDGSDDIRRELLGTTSSAEVWNRLLAAAERWGALYFVDHRSEVPDEMLAWAPDVAESDDPDAWHPRDCLFAPLTARSGDWVGILSVDLPQSPSGCNATYAPATCSRPPAATSSSWCRRATTWRRCGGGPRAGCAGR